MEQLIARFHQIVKEFRGKGHDLLDYHNNKFDRDYVCLLYTSPSPRDRQKSRMPSSA